MQLPTCANIRIRSAADAHVVLYAVTLKRLPIISHRLDVEERQFIEAGAAFVWEERDGTSEATGAGITRWTDGRRWGPSRVRDEFLVYYEKLPDFDADPIVTQHILGTRLVKQTYSAFVNTAAGRRKWHLVAYDTAQTLEEPSNIDSIPLLQSLRDHVPEGAFVAARIIKAHARSESLDEQLGYKAGASQRSCHAPDALFSLHDEGTPSTLKSIEKDIPDFKQSSLRGATAADMPSGAAHLPDPHQAQSTTIRQGPTSHDLPPLMYLRKVPYPPRHPTDNIALRSLESRVRIV